MSEVSFSFDDKLYKGHLGEPMAAALLRSGVLSITNSTYRGRPRGIVSLGIEEPNALVQLVSGTKESMLPATVIEVTDGLDARSLTGIGALPEDPDEARYDRTNRYVDILIIGAGSCRTYGGGGTPASRPRGSIDRRPVRTWWPSSAPWT